MNKYKAFDNYLKEFPTADGYFGEYGGAFLPPELVPAFEEADSAYEAICHSAQFINETVTPPRNWPLPKKSLTNWAVPNNCPNL